MPTPLIYLAGFDVFRRNAIDHGRYLKDLCAAHGMQGLYPFDNQIEPGLAPQDAAQQICQNNIDMLQRCTAVLANLNAFRGHEPDSGAAFEVGMALALGKPVWAYCKPLVPLREQIAHDAEGYDEQDLLVEDFGLPRNLMLACSWAGVSSSVELGAEALARYLERNGVFN